MSKLVKLTLVVLIIGLITVAYSGASYAVFPDHGGTTITSGSTAPRVCPEGETPSANLAECAQCTNAAGCVKPTSDSASGGSCSESSCDLIKTYLDPAISLLSALVGVACVVSLISAGIQYTTAGGDAQKTARAKSRIVNTIVAFLAFTFLWAFLEFLIPGGVINPGS